METSGTTLPVSGAAPEALNEAPSEVYFADFNFSEVEVTLEAMMKHGVHFGHQKSRRNPKMKPFVFTTRKSVDIIDLQRSSEKLAEALEFLRGIRSSGKSILFVGTKKQSQKLVKSLANRFQMPFVADRWLGGTFTNFKIIKNRTRYLLDSEDQMMRGDFKKYTKFEQVKKAEEIEKLEQKLGGIKHMTELPGAMFVTDVISDALAVREAQQVGVPIVAIADTNVDPSQIDYPIPANDDAVSSIRFILSVVGKMLAETPVIAAQPMVQPTVKPMHKA
ncbi:30S ribosomal protein S2 [Patescibacteria group bacterium]|nr:MAG: 30S ribosomal protein S2 [Patescibacteria group bacterium]